MLATTTAAWGVTGRRWEWAAAGTLAALYLNNLAVLFLAGIWVGGLIVAYRQVNEALENFSLNVTALRNNFFWGAMALIWILAGALPAFYMAVQQAQAVGGGYWIPPLGSPGRLLATVNDLLWFTDSTFIIATALITGWLLVIVVVDLVLVIRAGFESPDTKLFLWVAIGLPLVSLTVISLAWQPLLISRAVAPLAPLLYILVAATVAESQPRLRLFAALAGPTLACILILSPGRAPVDREMLDRVPPHQALYHANVGSYLVWKYYRPDLTQYVWPQQTTLKQTLTPTTRVAMGLKEVDFEFVKCMSVADGRGAVNRPNWWIIYFHNPTTSQDEIDYVAGLEERYGAGPGALLRHDQVVEARLVRLQPDCASLPPGGGD
ncbi:MAG: hypothetical protein HC875_21180 [Anaerolineales bacterium]|nr:hypothetical protein [Anaerolineales bacterium]